MSNNNLESHALPTELSGQLLHIPSHSTHICILTTTTDVGIHFRQAWPGHHLPSVDDQSSHRYQPLPNVATPASSAPSHHISRPHSAFAPSILTFDADGVLLFRAQPVLSFRSSRSSARCCFRLSVSLPCMTAGRRDLLSQRASRARQANPSLTDVS